MTGPDGRRGSPSSWQRLKKSSDTIKHCRQWQNTECLMPGNNCARCSEVILCIIKFHPNRRIYPITINRLWKWSWDLCSGCGCMFRVRLCMCPNAWVQKEKRKNCKCKSDSSGSLGVWQSSQNPLQAMATHQHKARLWGRRYLCRTPAAKVTALSQITTVDPQPLKRLNIICYPPSGGEEGRWEKREGYWRDQPRWGAEECHRGIETERFVLRCHTPRIKVLLPLNPTLWYSPTDWIMLCVFQKSQN